MQEIQKNIAQALRRSMESRQKTLTEFSEELNISKTAVRQYLHGTANPRADTLTMLADSLGITPAELITGEPPGWSKAALLLHAAQEIGPLPPEQQREAVRLFLALVAVFSE